ncbi:MAG TPA: flagellar motor switch protein FliM [Planctomycetaceae bacterium]|jgi:flagellar motor switch protein FliM|nr:flagellar motor switch protein FliM [Planctomycetaceae bacterium]
MADILSQSEVESLLAALDTGPQRSEPQQSAATSRSDAYGGQVSVYDFKRPERVSKEQMRAFQAMHDGFSREFGAVLSGMLRTIVEVKLSSVDQLTYGEFVFSLENMTCFNVMRAEGLDGHMILDLTPSIIFPIVDRLLGGGKSAKYSIPSRPLTEIELRLIDRIIERAIEGLEKSWASVCELKLRVTQVESNPQLVQIVPPNEVIVLISFEITMGEIRGIMNLCIPFNTIEPLMGNLSSDTWSAYTKRTADPRQKLNLQTGVGKGKVKMVVGLADTRLTAQEIMGLSVGDVIMTEKGREQPLEVYIEGRPLFRGSAGLLKGHKAIQISSSIARTEDLVEAQLRAVQAAATPAAATPTAPAPASKPAAKPPAANAPAGRNRQ